jgi:protein-tyrosine phosphatase
MPGERRIALAGAENFRDLGGYRTADGRTVRWGRLFRSDHLARLTPPDVVRVGGLGLRLVCDLRTPGEQEGHGDLLPVPPPSVAALPVDFPPLDPNRVRRRLLAGDVPAGTFARLLTEANESYAGALAPQFADVLQRLATASAPLPALIHCNGGKDRTGFAAALVLLALGVPRATVLEDYLLTNAYTARTTRRRARLVFLASRFAVRPREMYALLEARAPYLEAGLAAMEARAGSIDAFLRDVLGLTDPLRDRLRDALLE